LIASDEPDGALTVTDRVRDIGGLLQQPAAIDGRFRSSFES
jgi:hypothetical protein